jgi:cell pole-organizing protein PopZ
MTPKSDHEDDMSMEEILASIRKFVTDSPPEAPKQKVYKSNLAESVVISPAGHATGLRQKEDDSRQPTSSQPFTPSPAHSAERESHPQHSPNRQPAPASPYEPDILELKNPVLPTPSGFDASIGWGIPKSSVRAPSASGEEPIMTLTDPIDAKKEERSSRLSPKTVEAAEQETSLGSAQALAASANSLSRLAQASKSVFHKKASSLADQRDLTLDQLIQDMIRPMIKLWIDTHLPSLVEDMVAKEIKRITDHLK